MLEKGYEVHGLIRRSSNINTARLDSLISKYSEDGKLNLYFSDLIDSSSLTNLINKIEPDEIYNLAAQSHVAVSFKNPIYSTPKYDRDNNFRTIRNLNKNIKFYQASSSECMEESQKRFLMRNLLNPKSPYAAGKVFSHNITKIYRESYNIFAVNGILFNHESPHRGETFVTRKISRAVGRIHNSLQSKLTLGNLDACRDWGFAGDYTNGMYLVASRAEDWVLSTGETHSVRALKKLLK